MKAILLAAVVLAACHDTTVDVGDLAQVLEVPAYPNHDVDLLFVVDNSPSMLDKQLALVTAFENMMNALATLDGGMPSLHIGVVTSDMGTIGSEDAVAGPDIGGPIGGCHGTGDDGRLQTIPELGGALYIEDIANADGSRTRNYSGELRDVFTQLASVGASGCGFEQHLGAMRRALHNPANGDFIRPHANLAVVFVADEDDCSMTHSAMLASDTTALGPLESFRCTRYGVQCDDGGVTTDDMTAVGPKSLCHARLDSPYVEDVQPFVDDLVALKGDPRAVMVASLAGEVEPFEVELRMPPGGGSTQAALAHSCTYVDLGGNVAVADPAIRLGQFAAAFPGRDVFETVCNADLSLSLAQIGYMTTNMLGSACVHRALADTSDAPGVQPSCDVLDGDETIFECSATNTDHCWRMVTDASCTGSPDQLRFEIVRPTTPATQQYASVRCLPAR